MVSELQTLMNPRDVNTNDTPWPYIIHKTQIVLCPWLNILNDTTMSIESIWYKISIIFRFRGESLCTLKASEVSNMHTDATVAGRHMGDASQGIIAPWRERCNSSKWPPFSLLARSHYRNLAPSFIQPLTTPQWRLRFHKQTARRFWHLTYCFLPSWRCRNSFFVMTIPFIFAL